MRVDQPNPPENFGARFALPILLGPALNPINTTMISVALVPIAEATNTSASQAVLLVVALYLASALAQPALGRVVDLYGPKRVYLAGMMIAAVAGLIPLFASTFDAALVSRVLIGIGTSAAYPAAMASIQTQSTRLGRPPPRMLFSALSVSSLTSAAIGPVLGGVLVAGFGWQAIFVVNTPYALTAATLALLWLPSDRDRPFLVLRSGERRHPLDFRLLAERPALVRTYARVFLIYTCMYLVIYGVTQWLQSSAGYSADEAGWMQFPAVVLAGLAAMAISRTRGIRVPMILAAAIPIVGGIIMTALDSGTPVWMLIIAIALFGPPQGLTAVTNQVVVYAQSPPERMGSSAGMSRTAVQLAAITASGLIGSIFGHAPSDAEMHTLGWIIATLGIVALALTTLDPALRQIGRSR